MLGIAYFLLKPARYAILMWGPVIVYERMPSIGKVASAIVPSAFEVAGLVGPILIGIASDRLFGARRMPACVISLMALTLWLILFVPTMQSGNIYLVVGLLFMMGVTLYGPDSMISGAAAIDFGTSESAGTATGFVNGCGSVGQSSVGCCLATSTPSLCFSSSPALRCSPVCCWYRSGTAARQVIRLSVNSRRRLAVSRHPRNPLADPTVISPGEG